MLVGIVGKPNVGKSTFFSALTMIEVQQANYPFTTIDPNKGVGFVRVECADKFFDVQCNPRTGYCVEHERFVPVELLDVAGLVPGAHAGKGLGNKFLDDLRQADVLIHVIDLSGSTNEKGEVVAEGSYDPANDVAFLEEEIDLWYFGVIKRNWSKFCKRPFNSKTDLIDAMKNNFSGIGVTENALDFALRKTELGEKKLIHWDDADLKNFASILRKKSKPLVIAANKCDKPIAEKNLKMLKEKFPDYRIIACSAAAEIALKKAGKAEKIKYIPGNSDFEIKGDLDEKQKLGLEMIRENILKKFGSTGVQKILNDAVFEELKYIAIFPGGTKKLADSQGNVLPDCFLLPGNSTALDFAFFLHTDIGKGFIKAVNVKTKQMIGKEYKLQHRDVIEIMFNK